MKIQFGPNLDFQREAINAVVDLFDGQEVCQTNFTVAPLKHDPQRDWLATDLGIGNRLRLLDEGIHKARGRRLYCNTPMTENTLKFNM